MNHPLVPDLTDLSNDNLRERIQELSKKLMIAHRTMPDAVYQVQLMLDDYIEEQQTRDRKHLEKLMDQAKKDGKVKDWDDIIDIS
jgi:hypothetical protein